MIETASLETIFTPYNPEHRTPCGYDCSVQNVRSIIGPGTLRVDGKELPDYQTVSLLRGTSVWYLSPGCYLLDLEEVTNIPLHLTGYGHPRSTLTRSGVTLHTAIWDPGYHGRAQVMMNVMNPSGFYLQQGARVLHMTFHRNADIGEGYQGSYQEEGLHASG